MIIIDITNDTTGLPNAYEIISLYIEKTEYRDNENNEAVSPQMRNEVTRTTYAVFGTARTGAALCPMCIDEFDTEDKAIALYDYILKLVWMNDRVFKYRPTTKGGQADAGDNQAG